MFTGLIEGVGTLATREDRQGDARIRVQVGTLPFDGVTLGESIAVNGACMTVVAFDAGSFAFDASNESLALTTLGRLPPGAAVNLERAMRADARLGGHLVSGHVDGVGQVLDIMSDDVRPDARSQRWRFAAPPALMKYIARKGSICVDGVSLTVNAVDDAAFEVALVPHTVAHTAFARTGVGDAVNLEIDLVARYVERLLHAGALPTPGAGA
jgi:riboflavin synthase